MVALSEEVLLWLIGLGSAFGIKLSSSIDDVVWLAPFLTVNTSGPARMQNSIIYVSVCLIQTLVAMAIAYSGKAVVSFLTGDNKNAWSTEKILTVGAGCLMALYSIKLGAEYVQEMKEAGAGNGETEKGHPEVDKNGFIAEEAGQLLWCSSTEKAPIEGVPELELQTTERLCSSRHDAPTQTLPLSSKSDHALPPSLPLQSLSRDIMTVSPASRHEKNDQARTETLFVIAFIGSVDDLTLFVPMLVGKGFSIPQLVMGALGAAMVIVAMCCCIGQCKPVADCLSSVPLVAIVVVFATTLLVRGFFFMDGVSHLH
jgi:hypothetical protein